MSSKPKIELLKRRNIGAIVTDTIAFVQANFKSLFSGLFYICSPVLLVTAIGVFFFFNGYFSIISKNLGISAGHINSQDTVNDFIYLIPFALLMLLGIYVSMCFIASVSYSYIKLYRKNEEITTNTLWNTSKKYIWKIFGAQFILLLAFMLAYGICFLPLFLLGLGQAPSVLGVILTMLLFLAFIILFFHFYVKLAFHPHLIVIEDMGIMQSFKTSYNFSQGIFWKIFLSLFLLSLIVSICGNIFQLPGLILIYFNIIMGALNPGEGDHSFISLLGSALIGLGMAAAYLLYSVLYIGISFTYYTTIEERQGIKSNEDIDSIGEQEKLD